MGEVDVAAEVVAVAEDRGAVVDADPGLRPFLEEGAGSRPPTRSASPGSGETTITSSPIVFTIVASEGSVASTVSTKRSIRSSASSSPSSSV